MRPLTSAPPGKQEARSGAHTAPSRQPTAGEAHVLEIHGVSLSFGGVRALTSVSLAARANEITAVIGPNGAGKTSLFNVISGFYWPQAGKLIFDGHDITSVPPHRRAYLGIARTFQNIALFHGMTVLENIKLGAHTSLRSGLFSAGLYLGRARNEETALREQVEKEIIGLLEIDHIRHKQVQGLPYGIQKRVELARSLVMHPKLLLLDEPVAGMNREEKEDMARFILTVQKLWGTTILLIEHDMGMVMDISDQVIVLNFGQSIASGTPTQIKQDPEVIKAYLGAPEDAVAQQQAVPA